MMPWYALLSLAVRVWELPHKDRLVPMFALCLEVEYDRASE